MHKIENWHAFTTLFNFFFFWQMREYACFASEILFVVIFWSEIAYVPKLWSSPGVGKCPAPGLQKICKCPFLETDRAGKCPAVAQGGLGAAGIDWCLSLFLKSILVFVTLSKQPPSLPPTIGDVGS